MSHDMAHTFFSRAVMTAAAVSWSMGISAIAGCGPTSSATDGAVVDAAALDTAIVDAALVDAWPTMGSPCATPNEFRQGTTSCLVCCGTQWRDNTCSLGGDPPHDAGPPDAGWPDASLACTSEGSTGCVGYFVGVCHGGELQLEDPTTLCHPAAGCP
jgi:hypothetical protein